MDSSQATIFLFRDGTNEEQNDAYVSTVSTRTNRLDLIDFILFFARNWLKFYDDSSVKIVKQKGRLQQIERTVHTYGSYQLKHRTACTCFYFMYELWQRTHLPRSNRVLLTVAGHIITTQL